MREIIVSKITFPLLARYHGLNGLSKYLRELDQSQYWPRDRLKEMQTEKLKKLLIHAYVNTVFYKQRFDDAGFNPHTFKYFDQLTKIPLLTKQDIQAKFPDLLAQNYSARQLHCSETGGTTGVKIKFCRNNDALPLKEAALLRFEQWAGWQAGKSIGIIWPARQDYVGHWTLKSRIKNAWYRREVVFPAAVLDDQNISGYLKQLKKGKPVILRSFPSPLYEIARYIKGNGNSGISIRGIITTGEPLFQHQRELFMQVFGCPVYDSYRSREAGPIAQECSAQQGLHINAESLYMETIQLDRYHNFDGGGEIVITDLYNYGMPFIRYRMGDMGIISAESCNCGRTLPLLKCVAGRASDVLIRPDKKKISPVALYLIDNAPVLIGQMQVIQDKIDHLIIRMTPHPPPTEELKQYHQVQIRQLFGPTMQITHEIVAEIPHEKSGKYLFTKCMLPRAEIN
jgi:phenylacetate-CoA ligase